MKIEKEREREGGGVSSQPHSLLSVITNSAKILFGKMRFQSNRNYQEHDCVLDIFKCIDRNRGWR